MVRPDPQELRRRLDAADEKFRALGQRTTTVKEHAFRSIEVELPIRRLDLMGHSDGSFDAKVYFETVADAQRLDTSATRDTILRAISQALLNVDSTAPPATVRFDIDSLQAMQERGGGFYLKFR